MVNSQNSFVWYDLMTTDTAAAEGFYQGVMGWSIENADMPGMDYAILSAAGVPVGGLMALPHEATAAGVRPGWIGHIGVDDVDAFAERLTHAGGSIHRPPADIPAIGRFAVVADPQGAAFIMFQPASGEQTPHAPSMAPGHTGWHELHAGDRESAFDFYAGLFGWTKDTAIDMGPMGIYQLIAANGAQVGGMMTKTDAIPKPAWLYYFIVEDIDAGAARVKQEGGQVLQGPHEVPGGTWIVQCLDPQGAMFALVGPHS